MVQGTGDPKEKRGKGRRGEMEETVEQRTWVIPSYWTLRPWRAGKGSVGSRAPGFTVYSPKGGSAAVSSSVLSVKGDSGSSRLILGACWFDTNKTNKGRTAILYQKPPLREIPVLLRPLSSLFKSRRHKITSLDRHCSADKLFLFLYVCGCVGGECEREVFLWNKKNKKGGADTRTSLQQIFAGLG